MKNCDFVFFLLKTAGKNIACGAVLTSTHKLCFRAKIKEHEYPCKSHFYYIKVGCKGVYIIRTCYHDEEFNVHNGSAFSIHHGAGGSINRVPRWLSGIRQV